MSFENFYKRQRLASRLLNMGQVNEELAFNKTVNEVAHQLVLKLVITKRFKTFERGFIKELGAEEAKKTAQNYLFATVRKFIDQALNWTHGDFEEAYKFGRWVWMTKEVFPFPKGFSETGSKGRASLSRYQKSGFFGVNKRRSPDKAPEILNLWREWVEMTQAEAAKREKEADKLTTDQEEQLEDLIAGLKQNKNTGGS